VLSPAAENQIILRQMIAQINAVKLRHAFPANVWMTIVSNATLHALMVKSVKMANV
jgi:hypothetical protein